MTIEDLGNIGEFIGSIGVVITLIYLAVQIRQNTRAIKGTTLDAITNHVRDELRWAAELSEAFERGRNNPDELSNLELDQLHGWLIAALRSRQNEFFQHKQGLLEDSVWQSHRPIIRNVFANPWAVDWWKEYGRLVMAPEFCDFVDEVLTDGLPASAGLHSKGNVHHSTLK